MRLLGRVFIHVEGLRIIKCCKAFDMVSGKGEVAEIDLVSDLHVLQKMAHAWAPLCAGICVRRSNMMPLRCSITSSLFWFIS